MAVRRRGVRQPPAMEGWGQRVSSSRRWARAPSVAAIGIMAADASTSKIYNSFDFNRTNAFSPGVVVVPMKMSLIFITQENQLINMNLLHWELQFQDSVKGHPLFQPKT